MTTNADAESLEDLPPSAKYVEYVLNTQGELTHEGLIDETGLHPRTLRNALDRLDEAGLIDARPDISDARKRLYSLRR